MEILIDFEAQFSVITEHQNHLEKQGCVRTLAL